MSDRDRISRLGEHIQSALVIASQLNLVLVKQLLAMTRLALLDARPRFEVIPADVAPDRKSFNSEYFRIVGSWDWDLVSDLVYADADVARLFGVPVRDAELGTSVRAYLPRIVPDDLAHVRMLLDRTRRTGGAYRATYRLISPDEGLKNILAVGRVVLDGNHRAVRFPGTVIELQGAEAVRDRAANDPASSDAESLTGEPRWRME